MAAIDWVARLALAPHPEGGWFTRIHADARVVETANGPRAAVTSIHYLLTLEQPLGRLHRNRSDILHFLQDGGPVEYTLLDETGLLRRVVLGHGANESLFLPVRGGLWKASRLLGDADHALVSEVVIPGFDFADHEFGSRKLLDRFPQHRDALLPLIRR